MKNKISKNGKMLLATFFACGMRVRCANRRGGDKFSKFGYLFLEIFHFFW
jgi:hypothetical protein